jgi:hypothetical protein
MADELVVLPDWVKKKSKSQDDEIFRLYFYLMKELHLSYDDLTNMPIPAILAMAEQLGEYSKEQEKAMKKAQRK